VRIIRPMRGSKAGMTKHALSTQGRRAVGAAASALAVIAAVLTTATPALATVVTGVVVAPNPNTVSATSAYTITFTATTALTAADSITIASQTNDTIYPGTAAAYTVNTLQPSTVAPLNAQQIQLNLAVGQTVAIGSTVTIHITGVTNPTTASTAEVLTLWTSQDQTHAFSSNYTIAVPGATSVTGVTASVAPLTPSVPAVYTIGFVSTTALAIGDTITLTAPTGTSFPIVTTDYTVKGTTAIATQPTVTPTGGGVTVTITTPVAVAAGGVVQLVASAVGNPLAGTDTLAVSTSKDTAAVASSSYIIGSAATAISALAIATTPAIAGQVSTYAISFVATTALTTADTITLTATGSTVFQTGTNDYTVQGIAITGLPRQTSARTITLAVPVAIAAGATVHVAAVSVVNPTAATYTLIAATSKDITPVTSSSYVITAATVSSTPGTPVNLAGADRFGTAIAASVAQFPSSGSAKTVVLARADEYADALVGTTLAASLDGPLLFANGGSLTPATEAEIQRVLPAGSTIYLLGGTTAMPATVATTLTSLGYPTVRYAGADRYGTALAVAAALGNPTTVLLATGINFPDALSAGPAAAHLGGVVLLTDGTVMPAAVTAYLTAHPGTDYAIGGPAVTADPTATALSGADRYATATVVASTLFAAPTDVGVASGTAFPDALSGGAFQARNGGPILLSYPYSLSTATSTYLTGAKASITHTTTFGGTAALSATVQASIATALGL
jgi:putative cell wall-binding protein